MPHSLCIVGKEKSETNLRLMEEAKKHFSSVFFVPIDSIGMGLGEGVSASYRTSDILKFGAVMPRVPKPLMHYSYQLLSLFPKETYMVVKPSSMLLASERFMLLSALKKSGIPTLSMHFARSTKAAARMIRETSYPVIIRSPERKTGVVVRNQKEAKSVIDALVHLRQPFIMEEIIREMVSVYVAYPEAVASVRKNAKDTDTVFSEGTMSSAKVAKPIEELAVRAAGVIEAHIARIDIALNPPRVANVELNPNLIRPSKATGVDIPRRAMEIIHSNYLKHHSSRER